jgi:catechol 2,3-dioxygenase-like lactoylglutathione lyase family enzyme
MIGYVTIGTNNIDKAVEFYDAVFATLGAKRDFKDGGWAGYGRADEDLKIYVCGPFDGKPANFGNGSMLAFQAKSRGDVEAFHAAALKAGGADEGGPGVRGETTPPFYAAYARDPDGNKLCAYARK